jgi:hypothetical protein
MLQIFKTPEVVRVYVGSFNPDAPISTARNPHGAALFEAEQKELLEALYEIPQRSADRKINEFVKRVRAARIHLLVVSGVHTLHERHVVSPPERHVCSKQGEFTRGASVS